MINGCKILLISVKTFNYEQYIVQKLEEFGADVTYFDEIPKNTVFAKGLIRIKRNLYSRQIENYYNEVFNKIKDFEFDYLFVIKGEVIPSSFLSNFKELNPNTTLIYYTWDSFKNNPHSLENLKYFDKKFTFDQKDAADFSLNFQPLFFIDAYFKIKSQKSNISKHEILFIGTAHSDRYTISQRVSKWCLENQISFYNYYYISNYIVFLYKKIFDKSFKKFRLKHLSFSSLGIDDIIKLYAESNIILDINHPDQTGLTMRTFEALGAGKKLITTNNNIKDYIFFKKENILIIDRDQPVLPLEFFSYKFDEYQENLLYKMSIEGWLTSIFSNSYENNWLNTK